MVFCVLDMDISAGAVGGTSSSSSSSSGSVVVILHDTSFALMSPVLLPCYITVAITHVTHLSH